MRPFGKVVHYEPNEHRMRYGTIVKYFSDKQFGFIKPDTGADIFFHMSVIEDLAADAEIKEGQAVKYEATRREQQPETDERPRTGKRTPPQLRATTVIFIDKLPGKSLSNTDASKTTNRHRKARKKKPTWRQ